MGLNEYDVVDPITGRTTTLQLSDEDAKLRGFDKPKSRTPANKQATPANKQATPANKGSAK